MYSFFFFNDTATTEIYTLSLHDALPISDERAELGRDQPGGAAARRGQARSRRPQGPAHGGGRGHEGQGADRRLRHLEPRRQPVSEPPGQSGLLSEYGELARGGGGSDLDPPQGREVDARPPQREPGAARVTAPRHRGPGARARRQRRGRRPPPRHAVARDALADDRDPRRRPPGAGRLLLRLRDQGRARAREGRGAEGTPLDRR